MSDPFTGTARSFKPRCLEDGMLVARDRLLMSPVGDTFLGDRSVCNSLGSMFSFRLGVTGRVGDRRLGEVNLIGELLFAGDVLRIDPEWLVCGRSCFVGVIFSVWARLVDDAGVVGLCPWPGDTPEVSLEAVPGLKSDKELRLFRRALTTPLVGIPRIDDKDAVSSCELPGRRMFSWDMEAPVLSREPGRNKWAKLVSISIDFERSNEFLGVLASESFPPLLLLSVRKIDETLLSPSALELSRCSPKPNRLRKEDALEFIDPAVCETDCV